MAVKSDLLAMQVQLADFQQRHAQAQGAVKTSVAALNTVLARPISSPVVISGELRSKSFALPTW